MDLNKFSEVSLTLTLPEKIIFYYLRIFLYKHFHHIFPLPTLDISFTFPPLNFMLTRNWLSLSLSLSFSEGTATVVCWLTFHLLNFLFSPKTCTVPRGWHEGSAFLDGIVLPSFWLLRLTEFLIVTFEFLIHFSWADESSGTLSNGGVFPLPLLKGCGPWQCLELWVYPCGSLPVFKSEGCRYNVLPWLTQHVIHQNLVHPSGSHCPHLSNEDKELHCP